MEGDSLMCACKRPALRYFGGKWRLAPWLIRHFPPVGAYDCFVDLFGGSASVILQAPSAEFMVYNDLDGEVVNFFTVLREQTDALVRAIQLTPYARGEYDMAWQSMAGLPPLERARRFYVRSWQSYGGHRPARATGWAVQYTNNTYKRSVDMFYSTDHLFCIAESLKRVQLECRPALEVIDRFDSPRTLFYADPPYLSDTRSARQSVKAYVHEMDDEAHRGLLTRLNGVEGMVVISGYPSALYEAYLTGWTAFSTQARTTSSQTAEEIIWLNRRAEEAGQETKNLPLFASHVAGGG